MVGLKEKTYFVREQWISFSKEKIDETFNLKERKNGSKFKRLVKEPYYQKIIDLLIDRKGNGISQGRISMSLLQDTS